MFIKTFNSAKRFPINIARDLECPEDAKTNLRALTFLRIRSENLFPILRKLMSPISRLCDHQNYHEAEELAQSINDHAYRDKVILRFLLEEINKCRGANFFKLKQEIENHLRN